MVICFYDNTIKTFSWYPKYFSDSGTGIIHFSDKPCQYIY